jgi:glycosyltransferase involved in cell wall biosynthesis
MNIAFLTSEYPHQKTGNSGGIGTSIKNLAQSLNSFKHNVHVLVYGQLEDAVFIDEGIKIHQIKNIKVKGLSWLFTAKKIEKIINTLHQNKEIDLVEAPDWTGITAFINPKKCPIVIRLNGSDAYFCHLDNRPVKWWNKFQEKRALQNANAHISVSQFTADLTNKIFNQNKNYTIIPNGIIKENFTSNNTQNNSCSILYFGTLIRKKGLLELPLIFNKVIEQVPEAKLILVGGDSYDKKTKNQSTWQMMQSLFTDKSFANTSYLGKMPYENIQEHIQKATICVFPSFAEALPVSWLEAMAMGKAVVTSNIGWAKEIIDNNTDGFLVNPKDHEAFANAIIKLLKDNDLRNAISKNAENKINQKFTTDVIVEQNINFYKNYNK